MKTLEKAVRDVKAKVTDQEGRVLPYAVAWWLGVPLTLLVLIWLIRGH